MREHGGLQAAQGIESGRPGAVQSGLLPGPRACNKVRRSLDLACVAHRRRLELSESSLALHCQLHTGPLPLATS